MDPRAPVEDMPGKSQEELDAMDVWTRHFLEHMQKHLVEGVNPMLILDAHLCASFNAIQSFVPMATDQNLYVQEFRSCIMKYATLLSADTPGTKH